MNKLIVHYCGGAGINISRQINESLSNLGEGYCSVIPKYLDTSANNMGDIPIDKLWLVGNQSFGGVDIDGSGGERVTNAVAIDASVKSYLDENKFTKLVTGQFHMVVFSASGGTGSVVGPKLIANLRTKGVPVVGVMIGDSSNGLSCKNTLNTIATLDFMSKNVVKRPIVMLYYNNHNVDVDGVINRESDVNKMLYNALSTLSLFLSGANEDIDTKDMINFLSPDNYTSITIAPSLYCITIHANGNINNDTSVINLIGRTLLAPTQDVNMELVLLQHKYGRITKPNAVSNTHKSAPLHLILTGNYLAAEHARLTNTVEEYDNISKAIKTTDLAGIGEVSDDGMIF